MGKFLVWFWSYFALASRGKMPEKPVPPVKGPMKTVEFELPADHDEDIKFLLEATGLKSETELVGNALTLFFWAVSEVKAGRPICSVDESSGDYGPRFSMPVLDRMFKEPEVVPINLLDTIRGLVQATVNKESQDGQLLAVRYGWHGAGSVGFGISFPWLGTDRAEAEQLAESRLAEVMAHAAEEYLGLRREGNKIFWLPQDAGKPEILAEVRVIEVPVAVFLKVFGRAIGNLNLEDSGDLWHRQ